jgi:hypothetical protein
MTCPCETRSRKKEMISRAACRSSFWRISASNLGSLRRMASNVSMTITSACHIASAFINRFKSSFRLPSSSSAGAVNRPPPVSTSACRKRSRSSSRWSSTL